ncbi:hypothetical protein P8452_14869 [Trifolium repens]|nr:hypothetical protein P8452_14869 [Trifolium repens]
MRWKLLWRLTYYSPSLKFTKPHRRYCSKSLNWDRDLHLKRSCCRGLISLLRVSALPCSVALFTSSAQPVVVGRFIRCGS